MVLQPLCGEDLRVTLRAEASRLRRKCPLRLLRRQLTLWERDHYNLSVASLLQIVFAGATHVHCLPEGGSQVISLRRFHQLPFICFAEPASSRRIHPPPFGLPPFGLKGKRFDGQAKRLLYSGQTWKSYAGLPSPRGSAFTDRATHRMFVITVRNAAGETDFLKADSWQLEALTGSAGYPLTRHRARRA